MSSRAELEEIAHTGGQVTIRVNRDAEGRVSYNISWTHMRPNPAGVFAVYALPQGVAVADIEMGRIGTQVSTAPV